MSTDSRWSWWCWRRALGGGARGGRRRVGGAGRGCGVGAQGGGRRAGGGGHRMGLGAAFPGDRHQAWPQHPRAAQACHQFGAVHSRLWKSAFLLPGSPPHPPHPSSRVSVTSRTHGCGLRLLWPHPAPSAPRGRTEAPASSPMAVALMATGRGESEGVRCPGAATRPPPMGTFPPLPRPRCAGRGWVSA